MKNQIIAPLFIGSLFLSASIFAQPSTDFAQVDQNEDGVLNTEEARTALPDVQISDENGDGIVNISEAESAIPGLTLSPGGQANGDNPVRSTEYQMILQAMERDGSREPGVSQ